MDPAVFADTYRPLGDGRWVKSALVRAVQLAVPVVVVTLEGRSEASCGDYLVGNPGGDVWPVLREVFEARYRLLSGSVVQ